jgi:hypothetical protein
MKTKVCIRCKNRKYIKYFNKQVKTPDGFFSWCKKCQREYGKKYNQKNRKKLSIYAKNRRKKYPWKFLINKIKQRCNCKSNKDYKYYGRRGIKCLITAEELKTLWFRDKAWGLKEPSIDRIDNNGNYEYNNCHFIEKSQNTIKRNKNMKKTILIFIGLFLIPLNVFAYNPNSFFDEAEIFVTGQRPKVDIEVSELNVTILADDFVDGVAEKEVLISNEGSVPCRIKLALKGVPVDLDVTAEVDNDFLLKGETTTLNIRVELSEQKDVEDFNFSILVKASLRP